MQLAKDDQKTVVFGSVVVLQNHLWFQFLVRIFAQFTVLFVSVSCFFPHFPSLTAACWPQHASAL